MNLEKMEIVILGEQVVVLNCSSGTRDLWRWRGADGAVVSSRAVGRGPSAWWKELGETSVLSVS